MRSLSLSHSAEAPDLSPGRVREEVVGGEGSPEQPDKWEQRQGAPWPRAHMLRHPQGMGPWLHEVRPQVAFWEQASCWHGDNT